MILKKQEKDNKIKAMYLSSTICASIFDKDTKDLIVIFNNGGQYKYPKVELTDYTRLEISESTGSDFNTYIKKKYTNFEKMDKLADAAIQAILNEVEQLGGAEKAALLEGKTKAMFAAMTNVIQAYIVNGKIDSGNLTKVEMTISEYNKVTAPATTPTTAKATA